MFVVVVVSVDVEVVYSCVIGCVLIKPCTTNLTATIGCGQCSCGGCVQLCNRSNNAQPIHTTLNTTIAPYPTYLLPNLTQLL